MTESLSPAGALERGATDEPPTRPTTAAPTPAPEPVVNVAETIAGAVGATPGVARLVPGLRGAVARLRRPTGQTHGDDGVSVVEEGEGVRVVIDIGVRADAVVIDTARAVRSAAQDVLTDTHPGPATVRVNVLSREPDDSSDR